jgi:MFS transporter, DHA1 family, inner membrane transport protein
VTELTHKPGTGGSASGPATSSQPSSAGKLWITIGVLSLGTFATGTDTFLTAGILPRVAANLHISVETGGQLVTIFALVYAISSPVLMTVTARAPRRLLLTGSMLLFGTANLGVLLVDNFAGVAVIRVFAAAGAAAYVPTAAVAAAMIAPAELRGRALALVIGGSSLATALGLPAGIWIADGFANWRAAFVFVSILAFVATLGIRTVLPQIPSPPAVSLAQRLSALKEMRILGVLLVTGFAVIGAFVVFTYIAPLLRQVAPYGSGKLQWLVFAYGAASVLGSALAGYGSDRWGPARICATVLCILIINFVLFPDSAKTLAGAAVAMAVWGMAGWGLLPPQQHRLVQMSPNAPNIVISLNSSAVYVGIAVGSSLGGFLVGRTGIGGLRWWAAGMEAMALVLSLVVMAGRRQRREAWGSSRSTQAR